MKIIFFGTPLFAAVNLTFLINAGFEIVAVVTPVDSKSGRGKIEKPCEVKTVALDNHIPILQPEKLKDSDFIKKLKSFKADIFIVVAFRMLPEVVWKIPNKGTINLHTSLLPNYRGAAPINWVLINGESETGVTTFFIDHNIDSGEIITQRIIKIKTSTTAAELHNELLYLGNDALLETIEMIKDKSVSSTIQPNNLSNSEAPKISKELLKINWNKSANDIHNLVRGLSPFLENKIVKNVAIFPSAWTFLKDENGLVKRIKIHLTEIASSKSNSTLVLDTDNKSYLNVSTKSNSISILRLQVEGKNPMSISQFLKGNKITKSHKIS